MYHNPVAVLKGSGAVRAGSRHSHFDSIGLSAEEVGETCEGEAKSGFEHEFVGVRCYAEDVVVSLRCCTYGGAVGGCEFLGFHVVVYCGFAQECEDSRVFVRHCGDASSVWDHLIVLAEVTLFGGVAHDRFIRLLRVRYGPRCDNLLNGFCGVVKPNSHAMAQLVFFGKGFAEVHIVFLKEVCIVGENLGKEFR